MAEPRVAFVSSLDSSDDEDQVPAEELPPPIPTGLELTALDPHFRGSPYDMLADMRERSPVHRDEELMRVFVSRYDDAATVLADDALFTDPRRANRATLARRRADAAGQRSLPL